MSTSTLTARQATAEIKRLINDTTLQVSTHRATDSLVVTTINIWQSDPRWEPTC